MAKVRILVIDDDYASRRALLSILDADGWLIDVVPLPEDGLQKLRQGGWNLVIANVSMSSLSGPLFSLLRDLHLGGASVKVLFLVPALAEPRARAELERWKLVYELKPIHLHDFLEQVGELLLEAGAIQQPLRRVVRTELREGERRAGDRRSGEDRRKTEMFSSREDYAYDEEELHKLEEEERQRKQDEEAPPSGEFPG